MRNFKFVANEIGDDQFTSLICEYYWRRLCRLNGTDKFNDMIRGILKCFDANPLVDPELVDE